MEPLLETWARDLHYGERSNILRRCRGFWIDVAVPKDCLMEIIVRVALSLSAAPGPLRDC